MTTQSDAPNVFITEKELFDAVGLLLQTSLTLEEQATFAPDTLSGTEPDDAVEPEGEPVVEEDIINPEQNILDTLAILLTPIADDAETIARLRRYLYNEYGVEVSDGFPKYDQTTEGTDPSRKVVPFKRPQKRS